jgi:hypothetical protein
MMLGSRTRNLTLAAIVSGDATSTRALEQAGVADVCDESFPRYSPWGKVDAIYLATPTGAMPSSRDPALAAAPRPVRGSR